MKVAAPYSLFSLPPLWSFKAGALCLLLCVFDFLLLGLILFSLPATERLNQDIEIYRQRAEGGRHEKSIRIGSSDYIRYHEVPETLKWAVLYLEDARFYQHHGFDPTEIWLALQNFKQGGGRLRGASTISQQLTKNLYLYHQRSFWRKFKEALITMKLESSVPKWRILEIYLNSIDWGESLIGLKAAAQFYFGKSPEDLSVFESAFLASLIPNPVRLIREEHKERLELRVNRVLELLYHRQKISLEDYRVALEASVLFFRF